MKWNLLYKIRTASRTPDKGATAPRTPFSLSSVLNWICWTPRTKFLGTPLWGKKGPVYKAKVHRDRKGSKPVSIIIIIIIKAVDQKMCTQTTNKTKISKQSVSPTSNSSSVLRRNVAWILDRFLVAVLTSERRGLRKSQFIRERAALARPYMKCWESLCLLLA